MKLKKIVICSCLVALFCVLRMFTTIVITNMWQVQPANIILSISGAIFGPWIGALVGVLADLIGYWTRVDTGFYFFGFTISAAMIGLIYGCVFRFVKIKSMFLKVVIAQSLVCVIVDLCLNTYWLGVMYGNGVFVLAPYRLFTKLAELPCFAAVTYVLLKVYEKTVRS